MQSYDISKFISALDSEDETRVAQVVNTTSDYCSKGVVALRFGVLVSLVSVLLWFGARETGNEKLGTHKPITRAFGFPRLF